MGTIANGSNDSDEVDQLLSKELLQLSFKDRNNIKEEIHGVWNPFPEEKENPESLTRALLDLDRELISIIRSNNSNGVQEEHIPSNREFKLAFLRCELFDVQKAAVRLIAYIKVIRGYCCCGGGVDGCVCGSFGCGRNGGGRIQSSKWFTKEEYTVLKKGIFQLMPYRDRSGRRVFVVTTDVYAHSLNTRVSHNISILLMYILCCVGLVALL